MLSLEEARQKILDAIQPLDSESVPLGEAFGRILAEKVVSAIDLPPFDNSAMDGYAVQSKDVAEAAADKPIPLRLIGKVAAGETHPGQVKSGTCVRIFTGSPLPAGADAVVMQEDTALDPTDPTNVLFLDGVKPWEHLRFQGEDIKAGALLGDFGQRLTTGKVSLFAATGRSSVRVGRKPVIGLLATGSELVEAGAPLRPGKIYESNRVGLATCIRQAGGTARIYPLVDDHLEATTTALQKAFAECDAIVTSGGVSVGEFDFVKGAFAQLGGDLSFWKVAIRPGKPFVFGRCQGKFLFGLPGNPVSALVTFFLLVRPALLRMQGAVECPAPTTPAILAEAIRNEGDRRHFIRVLVDGAGNVRPLGIQASHILSALADANGLLDVPPKTDWAAGTKVAVIRWE
jgi:molybdopterin molybdotransferase